MEKLKGALFDLDGVLVDTASYHYLAWKELANELNIPFTKVDNERLKGVSRMASLDILLSLDKENRLYTSEQKEAMATRKNDLYVQLIRHMDASEILPGVVSLLKMLREQGVKIALGSASKNAPKIMASTGLSAFFDAVIDGNVAANAKPDPEVFLKGAAAIGISPDECAVFEDAEAGLQAAKSAGCFAIGVGESVNLPSADVVYSDLTLFDLSVYF
ncbi:beta-phosphoglucomutase [Enterococcus phoeniculicola]|jgi:beta-phosphoglucomutase|uniref:Beta-phosphoglucomutase n=1 Tax=Enterococcus phoeniculicola ATCC BAA-412 TaxID=1158610 RepID=R3TU50_9ENTE|nr:beta-phosphoglucomutase [Enterococcus phoeniculicola]EOL44708.1 beta-phosphoglucomutase [Enterococcus phoeniculicola ATCC BAA-412]EOT74997.1 beta-phosphoglucomutase [Enterococcus phoeniculicola ATCC BAA-412]